MVELVFLGQSMWICILIDSVKSIQINSVYDIEQEAYIN